MTTRKIGQTPLASVTRADGPVQFPAEWSWDDLLKFASAAKERERFENSTGPRTLFYRKALPAGELDPLTGYPRRWRDPVYVAVNVDPRTPERGILHPDLPAIGIGWQDPYRIIDLITGRRRTERGADVAVDLTPEQPFRIFTISALEA